MFKNLSEKWQIKIWGWPTLIFYALYFLLVVIFAETLIPSGSGVIPPNSERERVYVCLIGLYIVSYLWLLIYRYKKYNIRISWLAKYGVMFLTIIFVLELIIVWYRNRF
ncbi:MAG: hypothetical protein FJ263_01605 [Planctomycetes bacterium]|nr:hypothetical protein [Planctomycetota bacterium]